MRHFFKEYGYLALMGLCLVCSAVLLVSVVTDRPLVAIAGQHLPVLRVEKAAEGEHDPQVGATQPEGQEPVMSDTAAGYVLTEDYLEDCLAEFLP